MNLLIVNYEYPPLGGGAANASWNIARSLAEQGHDITVLTSSFGNLRGWSFEDGVSVYRCRSLRRAVEKSNILEMASYVASSFCAIRSLAGKKRFRGAIVFFSFPCGPIGLYAKRAFDIPYVVSLRGGDVPGAEPGLRHFHAVLKPLRRKIFENALAVASPSDGLKRMAQAADPVSVEVIPNGVDFEFFKPLKEIKRAEDKFTFLFVGRFQPQKNLRFMLEQFARFKQQFGDGFVLRLVGDGPQKRDMVEFCEQSGIGKQARWHGWVDRNRLLDIYRQSDCLVNLSLYEGMSNAAMEAIACELPVIASDVPGNRELILHGKTGFLVEFESEGILSCLLKVANDRNSAKMMGRQGRKHVQGRFHWKDIGLRYLSFFR